VHPKVWLEMAKNREIPTLAGNQTMDIQPTAYLQLSKVNKLQNDN
jgi:hypothetical protein